LRISIHVESANAAGSGVSSGVAFESSFGICALGPPNSPTTMIVMKAGSARRRFEARA
jgi:hypothetical protein